MRLNSQGTLAKFYMWLPPDDKKLPQDLCTYFWGLVGRACFIFLVGGSMAVSIIYGLVRAALWFSRLVWANKATALYFLSIGLFTALILWLSGRKKKIKVKVLNELTVVVKAKVEAVKGRYCPRIEWDANDSRQ